MYCLCSSESHLSLLALSLSRNLGSVLCMLSEQVWQPCVVLAKVYVAVSEALGPMPLMNTQRHVCTSFHSLVAVPEVVA